MALLIPMITIVLGLSIPLLIILSKYLRRRRLIELCHLERMAAIEKGIEIPAVPEALLRESDGPKVKSPGTALLKGLIWSFIGLTLFFALREEDRHEAVFGLVPLGVGLAYLIYYFIEGRKALPAPPVEPDPGPQPPLALEAKS